MFFTFKLIYHSWSNPLLLVYQKIHMFYMDYVWSIHNSILLQDLYYFLQRLLFFLRLQFWMELVLNLGYVTLPVQIKGIWIFSLTFCVLSLHLPVGHTDLSTELYSPWPGGQTCGEVAGHSARPCICPASPRLETKNTPLEELYTYNLI